MISGGRDSTGDAKQFNFVYFDKYILWAAGYVTFRRALAMLTG